MGLPASRSDVTNLLVCIMRYMVGAISLEEAARSAGVEPAVISQLSSEYASYMLPRAARAVRSVV